MSTRPAPRFPRLKGRLPPQLARCPGCGRHLFPTAKTCPFCAADVVKLGKAQQRAYLKAQAALERLRRAVARG